MGKKTSAPLNLCRVMKPNLVINRVYMFSMGLALLALFYYRITTLFSKQTHLLAHLLIFTSELIFTLMWVLHQAFRWKPVVRTVHPDRLQMHDQDFPAIDVFVCTADPVMEPSLGVMNTVLSAMALDYPPEKLSVYLSDDGGSFVTLNALREAWKFAKWWVPFCRKYELKTRCAGVYFSSEASDDDALVSRNEEFVADKKEMERRYDEFKASLEKYSVNASSSVSRDHAPIIEMMSNANEETMDSSKQEMPHLVYVAREKRPSYLHHFKGGAINTLIRVSAVISNAPYILILDCDHYCNDPTSARQAMCFYLDPEMSPTLAFVQFPQTFHNMSVHDIYDGRLNYYNRRILGVDGVGGPTICGCNLYLKREALYGTKIVKNDIDVNYLKKSFGSSNEMIKSIYDVYKPHSSKDMASIDALKKELELLASCTYDNQSEWGKEHVGFVYLSVVEDYSTSIVLHSRGWKSVWIDPPKPCFLGSCTTNLSDMLVQQARWGLGLLQVSLSKNNALLYGPRRKMSTLHSMCHAANALDPIYVIPFYGISIVPQVCLLHGVSLYPKVSDPFFLVLAFIFAASQLKHVQEVVFYGDSIREALYELRVWMMKSSSSYLYATLGVVMDKVGLQEANFTLTNKVVDDDQTRRFHKGVYDFQASPMLIAPMCSLYILNVACFIMGVARIIQSHKEDELFAQAFISLFGIIVNYHVFDGMVMRKDRARISTFVSLISVAIVAFILSTVSLILMF